MPIAHQKAIVRRYFEDVLDKRNIELLDELVATACIIHRPEMAQPIVGIDAFKLVLTRILEAYSGFSTTIHDLIEETDRVACRLSHRAVNRGDWVSRIGRHAVAGKEIAWQAIAIFRFEEGKIAEEWVSRDELGMLIELGILG